jgi:hypothetical protein
VAFDLQQLEEGSNSQRPFIGGHDIARLAKDKGVIKDAHIGLADLCAKVLHWHLEKDPNLRVSSEWSNVTLSEDQKWYAALDVWASLQIYKDLEVMAVPAPLSFSPPPKPGTEIFLYQEDQTKIIARGQISVDQSKHLDGINISPTRTLIDVHDIYVPGAIITVHHGRPLSSFGAPPFPIVCKQQQVYSFVESFIPPPVAVAPPETQSTAAVDTTAELPSNIDASDDGMDPGVDQTMDRLNITFADPSAGAPSVVQPEQDSGIDIGGRGQWDVFLRELAAQQWPTQTRSRVLKDIFHVFQMIIIPKTHGEVFSCSSRCYIPSQCY